MLELAVRHSSKAQAFKGLCGASPGQQNAAVYQQVRCNSQTHVLDPGTPLRRTARPS